MNAPPSEFDTDVRKEELALDRARFVETPWGSMALYRVGERVHCVQAFCPHLEGPLFEGSISHGVVTCPWHGWRFDVATGERVDRLRWRFGEDARPLTRCEVEESARGTILLRAPRDPSR
jgi:nitrite reductase/ring-hydroxylating ferredoxin subunit